MSETGASTLHFAKIGRPRKFQSVEELEATIERYFIACDDAKAPYTITGLALALGTNRQTLLNYEGENAQRLGFADSAFVDVIKRAKAWCEHGLELRLIEGKGHPAGPIFCLKNNYGWRDVQEVQSTHRIEVGNAALPVIELSPALETSSALSLAPVVAVSDANAEAKGPPTMGVSPASVA